MPPVSEVWRGDRYYSVSSAGGSGRGYWNAMGAQQEAPRDYWKEGPQYADELEEIRRSFDSKGPGIDERSRSGRSRERRME